MKNEFFNKVKTLFSSELDNDNPITEKFLDIKTEDGRVFRVDGEELIVDVAIKEIVEPEEGDDTGESGIIDIEDGEYILEDGRKLVISNGVISEIIESDNSDAGESDPNVEMNKLIVLSRMSINTENMAIIKETYVYELEVINTDFKVGDIVKMIYSDDGEEKEYSVVAGTYELEDGRFINTDNEGKIILITDKDGNVLEAPEVDSNIGSTEESMSEVILDAFNIIKNELDELKENYSKLEEKYNKISKLPSDKFEKQSGSFKQEKDIKRNDKFSNSPIRKMFGYN